MPTHDAGMSDQALVSAINQGDDAAFEALYRRHRDYVLRIAMRFCGGDSDLALDAMQETFTYLLGKFPGFTLTAKMTTFLYPAAKHYALAAKRKRARYVGDEVALAAAPARPAHATDDPTTGDDLQALLGDLSDEHREAVLLRFVDGLSLQEAADLLEIPLGTVKSRLHHAITALRRNPRTKEYFEQ